jgi:hypothetical protein
MQSIDVEFAGAELGDRRLSRRLVEVAATLAENPEKSFPKANATPAGLRATYRLMSNDAVTADAVLEPHRAQTEARARAAGEVLVVHDTTELAFRGEEHREGLGFLHGADDQGFLLHVGLVISAEGKRSPLGVIASRTWARSKRKGSRSSFQTTNDPTSEGRRWTEQIEEVDRRLEGLRPIHVADREVDAFANLQAWTTADRRFVVRARSDRAVLDEHDARDGFASEAIATAPWLVELEVPIARRKSGTIPGANPARDARIAKLRVNATRLILKWPNHTPSVRRTPVEVNVVHALEVDAPTGADPVSWVLYTSEPLKTASDALKILEFYRTRWLVEEFFKALKTGCAVEKRQLETYDALAVAAAIFIPIAWRALALRALHRSEPKAPATDVLTPSQLAVLRAKLPKLIPLSPTVDDALRAVAWLGGHFIKKPPGWQVLCRGMEDLLMLEAGWLLAQSSPATCG